MHQQEPDNENDKKKHLFKIDISWINDMTNIPKWFSKDILEEVFADLAYTYQDNITYPLAPLPVNDYFSNTESGLTSLLYLGNNQYQEQVWKKKYFVVDKLKNEYMAHLQSNAKHFVAQPNFYKGLFEILN